MTPRSTAAARTAAVVAASGALSLIAGVAPAGAAEDVRTSRWAGPDRFATAVDVAADRVAGADASIETVLLARADDFPDALAGAGLAGMVGGISGSSAPILLTRRDRVPASTAQALQDFSVRRVVLLGGTDAVSAQVEAQLAQDHDVQRVAGADRYATAAEAARVLVANTRGLAELGGQTTVLVASGRDFADALAGGPVAYAGKLPILLTGPDELPAATAAVLDELAPEQALLLGGEAALSAAVEAQIQQRGATTRRLGGVDRQATAALIADLAVSELGFDGRGAVLARGDAFPDALAGAPQAGRTRAPILLTQSPSELSEPTRAWLASHRDTLEVLQVVGGSSAVTAATVQQAEQAVESGGGDGGVPGGTLVPCAGEEGFTLHRPESWSHAGCTQLHPQPFEPPGATDERVAAITAYIDPVPFHEVAAPDPDRDAVRATTTIDGLQAVRLEYDAAAPALWPQGTPITLYAVDLSLGVDDGPGTLFLDTVGLPGFDYARNQVVLDRVARTVEVTRPDVPTDPRVVARFEGGGGGFRVEGQRVDDRACLRIPPGGEQVCAGVPRPDELRTVELVDLEPVLAGITGADVFRVTAQRAGGGTSTVLPAPIGDSAVRGFAFTLSPGEVERLTAHDVVGNRLGAVELGR